MISRRYRNRRIGDFLKELKLVEGRNTGIPTILRAMETNGSQLPVFETDENRTYFTVILPVNKHFLSLPEKEIQVSVPKKIKKKRRNTEEIKGLVLEILERSGDMPTSELAATMDYAKVTAALSKAIKELMAEGRVVYWDPKNPHSRNQKICLVKKPDEK